MRISITYNSLLRLLTRTEGDGGDGDVLQCELPCSGRGLRGDDHHHLVLQEPADTRQQHRHQEHDLGGDGGLRCTCTPVIIAMNNLTKRPMR